MRFIKFSRCFASFCFLFLLSCAHDWTISRDCHSVRPSTDRRLSTPNAFALTVSRSFGGHLVAWGHLTGSDAQPADWALLADREMVNYLFSIPLPEETLERVGDNSRWSPYLLRWKNQQVLTDEEEYAGFVTSFQMPVADYFLRERTTLTKSAPSLDRQTVTTDLDQFKQLISLDMAIDGFTPQ